MKELRKTFAGNSRYMGQVHPFKLTLSSSPFQVHPFQSWASCDIRASQKFRQALRWVPRVESFLSINSQVASKATASMHAIWNVSGTEREASV